MAVLGLVELRPLSVENAELLAGTNWRIDDVAGTVNIFTVHSEDVAEHCANMCRKTLGASPAVGQSFMLLRTLLSSPAA